MKNFLSNAAARLRKKADSKKGSVSIEYVIIIIAIVVVVAGAMMLLGGQVKGSITETTGNLASSTACAQNGGIWRAGETEAEINAHAPGEGANIPINYTVNNQTTNTNCWKY